MVLAVTAQWAVYEARPLRLSVLRQLEFPWLTEVWQAIASSNPKEACDAQGREGGEDVFHAP
jgi:hypothetical protein